MATPTSEHPCPKGCTRPNGHSGAHLIQDKDDQVIKTWQGREEIETSWSALRGQRDAALNAVDSLTASLADCKSLASAVIERLTADRDEALTEVERNRATIEHVRDAAETLGELRDAAKADSKAAIRGAAPYADAYENAERLVRAALDPT